MISPAEAYHLSRSPPTSPSSAPALCAADEMYQKQHTFPFYYDLPGAVLAFSAHNVCFLALIFIVVYLSSLTSLLSPSSCSSTSVSPSRRRMRIACSNHSTLTTTQNDNTRGTAINALSRLTHKPDVSSIPTLIWPLFLNRPGSPLNLRRSVLVSQAQDLLIPEPVQDSYAPAAATGIQFRHIRMRYPPSPPPLPARALESRSSNLALNITTIALAPRSASSGKQLDGSTRPGPLLAPPAPGRT
ncbi:hypothetical protein R3P38DRAFT_3176315 [Favolaschia claudopus]|uniref:Uncharacterized protein n=1 Tax=Favolaschia claudopus TaxID=2862362 RepID=A0AAW0D7C7_9AGAR